ncbi:hypothetical protein ACE1BH_08135 [Aeromonas jandaei]
MTKRILEICFTGFGSIKKRELIALAKSSEKIQFVIRTEVTKKLDILCCGKNAGPIKIHEAQEQGCLILQDEHDFLHLVDTGSITIDGKPVSIGKNIDPDIEVCFTGFTGYESHLNKLKSNAVDKNIIIRSRPTKGLTFICCNQNQDAILGHEKIAEAMVNGASIISDSEFSDMLETGELPKEPWFLSNLFLEHEHSAKILIYTWSHIQQRYRTQ